ncbi:hypothetical protein [Glaciecola sp. KUL10]|uniref:hypothetical protein n=1 Tax=Glaciecola sp. (strain KUL10) TaxID=2161813 RepID=UPI000D784E64|nr:hypothetical protein [Glaciecola sp. KUL10]GBL03133.1 hypothetical protein KUL10_04140 [Glaciecola sp. KUL10]
MKNIKFISATLCLASFFSSASIATELDIKKSDIKQNIELSLATDTLLLIDNEVKDQFKQMLANANLKSQAGVYLTSLTKTINSVEQIEAED